MSYIKIILISSTAEDRVEPGGINWLDFWEKRKGKSSTHCRSYPCYKAPAGARLVERTDQPGKVYLLPLCEEHILMPEGTVLSAWESDLELILI